VLRWTLEGACALMFQTDLALALFHVSRVHPCEVILYQVVCCEKKPTKQGVACASYFESEADAKFAFFNG
jgi:hypothetical protein